MRKYLVANLILLALLLLGAFSYTGDGSDGFVVGESITPTNMNEIDTAIDAIHVDITALQGDYLSLTTGGTITGGVTFASGSSIDMNSSAIAVNNGSGIEPSGTGYILATGMSATGQIDDNDIAAGAVDGGTGGEIADDSITAADIATSAVTTTEILNDTVALTTDTAGDYVATISNSDGFITVSGAGTEGRAVTVALAATAATQQELDDKTTGSSTDNAIVRFDGTLGDVQDSLATVADTTGNITTPGALSAGGSTGASTFTLRNMADSGWVECGVSGTTFTCAVDADGTPDGTL